ncbi:hypothetical protein QYE76_017865 [Lolium multiflorum]|uniref:No apical meristem-associated C-terminal domain-containing protein n=1 Tax=Lolium multiflorum TaxID=4521 RepID=A0AAD8PYP5_LOLMU|nr:hypothetical protein QYE76_017865 [Lolium multiflorum]
MEAAAPAEAKRAATGGPEAKPKAAKKVLSMKEKCVEAAKCRGRRKNLKEKTAAAANQQAWQMQMKAGVAQVALHPSIAEGYMLVKREGIADVAPPASSVSSVSSQLRPGTPAPLQGHPASRFASGVAPVQFTGAPLHFNGASVPELNRTPRSGDSCPGATHKTRQLQDENMPEPRIMFDEMAPPAPTMDDPAYWKDRHETDIQAMIFGGGFIGDDRGRTGPQDEWAPTQDVEDIDRAQLFATQTTQPTPVCVDDFDDAPTEPALTADNASKKKGRATGHKDSSTTRTSVCATRGWQQAMTVSRALERFTAVHKKGYHMVHCWEKLKDAEKWKTSFAAYDAAVKNGTAVNLDGEDDDHGRQALPPRPRGNKATKADLAREAQAIAFTQSMEKMMAENHAAMAARDEKRRLEKEAATAIYHNLAKEVIEVQRMDVEAKKAGQEDGRRGQDPPAARRPVARRPDARRPTHAAPPHAAPTPAAPTPLTYSAERRLQRDPSPAHRPSSVARRTSRRPPHSTPTTRHRHTTLDAQHAGNRIPGHPADHVLPNGIWAGPHAVA